MNKIKTIRSYAGHARFLAECDETPVGFLARVQVEEIPSPYAYSPTQQILRHAKHGPVVIFETSHRVYSVFSVPAEMLRFKTELEAEDWHIRFYRRAVA